MLQQITAVNGADNDKFADAIAISNDRIVVGSYLDDVNAKSDQGSVQVFAVQAQDWYVQASLAPYSSTVYSTAIYGEWLAVGLSNENVNGHNEQGMVKLYRRNQGGLDQWQLFKQFSHSNGAAQDHFGSSVALYGDLLAVGVPDYDNTNINQGAVTIFKRDLGGINNWGEWVTYEIAEDFQQFGSSVALHQDLLVIGASWATISGKEDQGRVWICKIISSGCSWKAMTASDGAAYDYFGSDVRLDNDVLAVSSNSGNIGAVYIYYRNQGGADNWGQVKKLSGAQVGELFGGAISVSGELLAVGSPFYTNGSNQYQGRVKIFGKNSGGADNWGEIVTILDASGGDNHRFGNSVALYYDRLLVGAPLCSIEGDGCVSAFRRNHGGINTWGRFERILGAYGSYIGYAVAINGETAVVGGEGQAQTLYFQANYWTLGGTAAPLESSESGGLGKSVAISGDLLVAGAPEESFGKGAAYLFQRAYLAPGSWSLLKRLTASDGAAPERFGDSVGISGDWIAVGSVRSPITNAGSVYLFEREYGGTNNWGQFKKIACPDTGACGFGDSLALSNGTLVVGAPIKPATYIFYRDQGGTNNWGQVKRLDSADWLFGSDVALDGDTLIVGAPEADIVGNDNQGAAYVFYRNQGGGDTWGQVKKLTASDGSAALAFGYSVAVHGSVAVVGAIGSSSNRGAAYIFYRNRVSSNNWGELKKLTASDGAASDWFGKDVAVYGDHILVGAHLNDIASITDQGSVYWFWRNYMGSDNWGQISRILLPQGAANDAFGSAIALWDDLMVVGAPGEMSTFSDGIGAAHVFYLMLPKEVFLPFVSR